MTQTDKPQSAIVTGAASGIGRQFAEALSQKDFHVLAVDINLELLDGHFHNHPNVTTRQLDVSSAADWRSVCEKAAEQYSNIDYLFNVAGVARPGFILETDISEIDRHIDINTKGVILGTKIIGQAMADQGHGHIINIASLAGVAPIYGMSLYSASKFAVRGFSLAASFELQKEGVMLSVICPDVVDTPMTDDMHEYPESGAMPFSGSSKMLTVIDLERAMWKVMKNKPREYLMPSTRGWLAKLGSMFPSMGNLLLPMLIKKGQKRMEQLHCDRTNK